MQPPTINIILLGITSLVAASVIIYWHRATRGTWRAWPAGRSLMGLLGIIAVGFGYGVVNSFLGAYPARAGIGFALYALFVGAIVFIGLTIKKEMRTGKNRLVHKEPPHTGPVNITVATRNEENPMVEYDSPAHRAPAPTAPDKAFWRTALQVGPAAALGLLVILPGVLQSIVDGFGRELPDGLYGVLVSVTGALTLIAAVTAKVMANPAVIAWTQKYAPFFAPQKQ